VGVEYNYIKTMMMSCHGHIGKNEKATATRIAAINVDVMTTTATVMTVGARRRCPWRQSQTINGSPRRTVSAGGSHGPILLGKSEAGAGGVDCVYPETY
jgi:hypothetical protein